MENELRREHLQRALDERLRTDGDPERDLPLEIEVGTARRLVVRDLVVDLQEK